MRQKPTITTVEQLMKLKAAPCDETLEWLAECGITDLADAWTQCHRGDWMLWLCSALDLLSDREYRLIACKCVRETPLSDGGKVWDLLADESRRAVAVTERYADGEATYAQLAAAAAAAAAAVERADAAYTTAISVAYAAATDAARAAYMAALAAARVARADAADAAYTAAMAAARTAAARAAAADALDAEYAAHAAQADIVRAIAGNPFRDSAS